MVVLCVMTEAEFSPVKWSPSLSEQCGEHGSPDLSGVLTTLTEMIVNNKTPSFLPKSCMEIKESSPVSPSGYYTISNGSGEGGVVVYCNMDDLSSCPALEQTLSGIKKDLDSLFTHNDGLVLEQALSEIKEDVDSLFTHNDSLALEQTLSEIKEDVDSLYTNNDSLALEQTLNEIKEDVDSLFTHNDSLALEQTLSGIKKDVDSLFTHIDSLAQEDTLNEIKEDVDSLFTRIDSLALEQTLSEIKEDVDSLFTHNDSLALEQTLSEIKEDVDSLFTHNDSLALEQTLSEIKEDVDSLFTNNDSLALEQTLNEIKEDVDSLFTHIDSSSVSSCIGGPLASSCLDLKERCPHCKSGVYEIAPNSNNVNFVDCAFENTYCNITGPWVKLASWNISETGSSCPSGLQLFVNETVSACGIQEGASPTCQSLPLFSSPVPYTQVCGRMRGYQKGSPDGFANFLVQV